MVIWQIVLWKSYWAIASHIWNDIPIRIFIIFDSSSYSIFAYDLLFSKLYQVESHTLWCWLWFTVIKCSRLYFNYVKFLHFLPQTLPYMPSNHLQICDLFALLIVPRTYVSVYPYIFIKITCRVNIILYLCVFLRLSNDTTSWYVLPWRCLPLSFHDLLSYL